MSVPPDSTLANLEQTIADLRRELAQLTAERNELLAEQGEAYRRLDDAQAREAATAEVLQVINSSPGNLVPVFDAMLEKAMRLCGAKFGILWKFDGEAFQATALRGVPPALAEFVRRPMKPSPGGAFSELVGGKAIQTSVSPIASFTAPVPAHYAGRSSISAARKPSSSLLYARIALCSAR